jgi:predicted ester cyclase
MKKLFFFSVILSSINFAVFAESSELINSEHTRYLMQQMDNRINASDEDGGYERYMSIFSEDIKAYGLIEQGPADLDTVKHHYKPVFEFFEDGVLVTESLVVAGNMAAQRYHSFFKLNGTFDKVTYEGKQMAIRGVTFFQFDEHDKIIKRWSNHDHAYRMGQILGKEGEEKGKLISNTLNGPGLSVNEVEKNIESLISSFNIIHNPKLRANSFYSFFTSDVKVMGIRESPAGLKELSAYTERLWQAFPDLVLIPGDIMSAWSYGALRLTGHGSQRQSYENISPSFQPAELTLELIVHFDMQGKIDFLYLYQHPFLESTH